MPTFPVKDLHWLDYSVFAFSLLLSVGTGVIHAIKARFFRRGGTTQKDEYLMGGRQMPRLPVALSLLTSFLSGILMLAVPAEMYQRGGQMWLNFMSAVLAYICTAEIFLPVFYKMQSTCLHEYFIHRYNSLLIRRLFSTLFILFTLCYLSVVIYAPCVALSEVLQINKAYLIILFGVSTTFYTCIGGIRAVVWADSLQAIFMYGGVLAVIVCGLLHERVGGLERVVSVAWESGRIGELWRVDPSLTQFNSIWINLVSGTIGWLATFGVNQVAIQRYNSLPSLKAGQTIVYSLLAPFVGLSSLVCFIGFIALAYFYTCDPIESVQIGDMDHLIILFARDILQPTPGLFGLYVSCIMAATLSTLSSGMNSLAAAVYEDFLKQRYDGHLTDSQTTLLNKGLTIISGIFSTSLAFTAEPLGGILRVCFNVMGAMAGPMVAIFVLALFFPRSGRMSCLISFVLSNVLIVLVVVANFVQDPYRDYFLPTNSTVEGCRGITNHSVVVRPQPPYELHYGDPNSWWISRISPLGYPGVGFLLMLAIALPLSLLEKEDPKLHYLTFYGRHEPWPADQHELDHLAPDLEEEKKNKRGHGCDAKNSPSSKILLK